MEESVDFCLSPYTRMTVEPTLANLAQQKVRIVDELKEHVS